MSERRSVCRHLDRDDVERYRIFHQSTKIGVEVQTLYMLFFVSQNAGTSHIGCFMHFQSMWMFVLFQLPHVILRLGGLSDMTISMAVKSIYIL